MTRQTRSTSDTSENQPRRRRPWTVAAVSLATAARKRAARREATDTGTDQPHRHHRSPPSPRTTTLAAGRRAIRHGVHATRHLLGKTLTRAGQALPTPNQQPRSRAPNNTATHINPDTPTSGEQQQRRERPRWYRRQ